MRDGRALRVGLLGAGTIARVHAGNLAQLSGARLVAVADLDAERAAELARPHDAAVVANLDALLARGALDAVLVCLPPFATRGVVARLAAAGLHVYAEKPVALDLADALADLAAVRRTGVVAASGYMWRASPIVTRAQALLAGQRVGLVQGSVLTAAPPPLWWRDKARSGGIIVELGTHIVDLLRLFGGEARRVTCVGTRALLEESHTMEDVVAATVVFASGVVGSLGVTCGTSGGRWSIDLVARDLHLALDFFPERLTGNRAWEPLGYQAEPLPDVVPHGFSGSAAWYLALRQFVDAARAARPDVVAASFEEGVRTLALTLALERSLQDGGMPTDVAEVP